MNKNALVIGICLGLVAGSATAQSQPYFYVGGGAGLATSNAVDKGFSYTTTSKKDTSTNGFKAYVGYSRGTWGIEGGYYDFGKYSIAGVSGIPAEDEYTFTAFALSAVGNLPLGKDFALTAKLGLASASAKYHCVLACAGLPDTSNDSIVPLFGIGASWSVHKNVALRVDWEGVSGVKTKVGASELKANNGLFSASVEARF